MGRQRQFTQLGVEALGSSAPSIDAQLIALAAHLLQHWGLMDHVRLELNTLGDLESRHAYRRVLSAYFEQHLLSLSPLSRDRFERGSVLRILDSKEEQARVLNPPRMFLIVII